MIKYFQKLKAKKGFTLVELIVVIAIIGVLAAILIPTMLGYVTQSKVTSANSTASSIKNEIDGFLTTCDTNGYGMKKGSNVSMLTITVDNSKWTVSATNNTTAFNSKGSKTWSAQQDTSVVTNRANNDITGVLALDLKELFPEVKSGCMKAFLVGGKCVGVLYTTEHNVPSTANTTFALIDSCTAVATNKTWPETYGWANQTLGIDTDGSIVGSAPVLQLNTNEHTFS